jgi:hypothetical protein
MQAGFAMVEAGFIRAKNTGNVLMKNILDFSMGAIAFWVVGLLAVQGNEGVHLVFGAHVELTNQCLLELDHTVVWVLLKQLDKVVLSAHATNLFFVDVIDIRSHAQELIGTNRVLPETAAKNLGAVRVAGDLQALGNIGDFDALFHRATQNPAIEIFASEERLREAEFQLAKSQSNTDIGWSVGVRQFQDTNDTALVAGLSIPLFSAKRNTGAIQSARAARDEVSVRREAALLNLRASLFDAYQQRKQGVETANSLRVDVIPTLTRALQQTQAAYENGRYGYQEWAAARQELISAEYALIAAASSALQSGATIEQLTSEPLLPSLEFDASETEQESN